MLAEWHLSPDEILDRWSEERLDLFWRKRNERMQRMNAAARGEETSEQGAPQEPRYVSNKEFFTGMIGKGLQNPNANRLKRIQVMN